MASLSDSDEIIPDECTYCGKQTKKLIEFFPHEAGGYCIFAPRNIIEYACSDCSHKRCELCNTMQIRFGFIDCDKCGKTHCYNNTDMKYENNPFLSKIKLCDAYKKCK